MSEGSLKAKVTENENYSSSVTSGVAVGLAVTRGRTVADAEAVFPAGVADAVAE